MSPWNGFMAPAREGGPGQAKVARGSHPRRSLGCKGAGNLPGAWTGQGSGWPGVFGLAAQRRGVQGDRAASSPPPLSPCARSLPPPPRCCTVVPAVPAMCRTRLCWMQKRVPQGQGMGTLGPSCLCRAGREVPDARVMSCPGVPTPPTAHLVLRTGGCNQLPALASPCLARLGAPGAL